MSKFFDMAIKKNHWLWFHCLAGFVLTWIFLKGFWVLPKFTDHGAVVTVFLIAFVYELLEFGYKSILKKWDNPDYKRRFPVDAAIDIIGALICSFIATYFF